MARSAVIAIVCFFLGGTAGWLLGVHVAPEDDGGPVAGSRAPSDDGIRVDAPGPVSSAPPAGVPGKPTSARRPPADPGIPELRRLLESVPVPEAAGTGRIFGRVVTPELHPVAGVLIRAMANRLPGHDDAGTAAGDRDLEAEIRDVVRLHRWQAVTRRETKTDAQGRYGFTGLADCTYCIRASCHGYVLFSEQKDAWKSVRPGQQLDFIACAAVLVSVSVLSPEGLPLPSCTVRVRCGSSSRTVPWSRDAPEIALTAGVNNLQATTPEGLASRAVTVEVKPGDRPAPVTLRLEPMIGIQGRVVVGEEEDPDDLYVWLVPVKQGVVPGGLEVAKIGRRLEVSAEQHFAYRFDGLEPGLHALGVGRGFDTADHVESVTIGEGRTTKDVHLPPPDPREYVHVTVLGPSGEPLTGVRVNARAEGPTGGRSESYVSVPGKKGAVWIRHSPKVEDDPGQPRHFVFAESPTYGRVEREYRPGEDRSVTLRFEAPAVLKVVLQGAMASGAHGRLGLALVRHPIGPGSGWAAGAQPDAEGHAVLGPVQPGLHDLVLHVESEEEPPLELARATLTLQAGENHWSLPVAPVYDVEVEIDAGEGMQVTLRRKNSANTRLFLYGEANSQGHVVFRNVPAGEYTLTAMPDGQMSIRVPAGGVIRFAPEPINAMRVRIDNPKGLLAEAGFQSGDLVVGMNGTRFKDTAHLMGLLGEGARLQVPVKLMVLRNGRELTILFLVRHMHNYMKAGGHMDPARWP
jgi:hypothetical protein